MAADAAVRDATVLIIDGDACVRDTLRIWFQAENCVCLEAASLAEAAHWIERRRPDLILLDRMSDATGIAWLRTLKAAPATRKLPVIVLSGRLDEGSRLEAFEAGAEDCLDKPFSPRELLARVRAVLRRSERFIAAKQSLEYNGLTLELANRRVLIRQRPVVMGPTEFRLLKMLMTHRERAFSRSQLLNQLWADNVAVGERTIDVHIRRLRKALDDAGIDSARLIQTVRGVGYRFSSD